MSARARPPATEDVLPDGEPTSIVRRAPFADSPFVGERGQQAQNKILEAALEVFGDVGYHGCGIKRITEVSGYSRASFYQYFSSKEDVFRHLAGRLARLLNESADALGPLTPDQAGWDELHDWLVRYSEIYDAYEAVFVTFQTAVVSDEMVASGSNVVANRVAAGLRAKIIDSPRTPAEIDTVIRIVLQTVARLNRETSLLEQVAPGASLDRGRANIAYADMLHRVLFTVDPAVNVHSSKKRIKALARPSLGVTDTDDASDPTHGPVAQQTRAQLLEAGHGVFVERGYYATRVADIVKAAGVSHGVFYRYFENKTQLFRILAERASNQLADALGTYPDLFASSPRARSRELRDWLGRYAESYASEAAIFTMWSEAISRDPELIEVSAALIDESRARLARALSGRDWGDAEADGMVLLVLLDAMTSQRGPQPSRIEPVADIIERSFLEGPTATRAKKAPRGSKGARTPKASARKPASTMSATKKPAATKTPPTKQATKPATKQATKQAAKTPAAAKRPTATKAATKAAANARATKTTSRSPAR
jgi:AcrR family transcriptional regulator